MKKLMIILLLIISTDVFAKGHHKLGRPIMSPEDEGVVHFTLESDTYYGTEYFSPLVNYAIDGWEFGLTSQNILITGLSGAQNHENDTYLNVAKTFKIMDHWHSTIGTQNGFVIPGPINSDQWHQFYFEDNDFELLKDWVSVHVGPYYVNQALSTTTSYFGYLTGTQITLIPHKLKLNLDYYSGHSNVSGATAQLTLKTSKHLSTFIGVGVPEQDSGNEFYGIIGFTVSEHFITGK